MLESTVADSLSNTSGSALVKSNFTFILPFDEFLVYTTSQIVNGPCLANSFFSLRLLSDPANWSLSPRSNSTTSVLVIFFPSFGLNLTFILTKKSIGLSISTT